MKQLRITRIQVAGAGLAAAVAIALVFWFVLIKPARAEIARLNNNAQAIEDQVRTERPKAEKALAEAKQNRAYFRKRYDQIMKTRMPDISFEDPLAAMFALQKLPSREGAILSAWFNSSGAQVSGYSFPAFGTDLPDPQARVLPPLTWNLTVTTRDFQSFLKWLEKLPKAPRFLVLNNVTLPGMRPPGTPFTATVQVTLYEWLKTPRRAAAAAAAAAQPAAGGAAGAGPGAGGRGRGGRGGGRGGGRWG